MPLYVGKNSKEDPINKNSRELALTIALGPFVTSHDYFVELEEEEEYNLEYQYQLHTSLDYGEDLSPCPYTS